MHSPFDGIAVWHICLVCILFNSLKDTLDTSYVISHVITELFWHECEDSKMQEKTNKQ